MYDVNNVYLYEVFEEYKLASQETKINIWREFCETLWQVPNQRHKYTKKLSYKILDEADHSPHRDIFEKYSDISYITYKTTTKEINSWHLLKQKLNNLYTNNCDKDVCLRKDFFYELGTAKRLYYIWLSDSLDISVDELGEKIKLSINNAETLKAKYGMQKMNLSWEQYKEIVNGFLLRCFENYIPLSEKEDDSKIILNIDFWTEDNYVIKYLGNSVSKYLKNYEKKEYYGICRKNTRDKRKYKRCQRCGCLFLSKSGYSKFCGMCFCYYKPLMSKVLKCIDCGCEFEVSSKANNRVRCDECTNKKKKLDTHIRVNRVRDKIL